MHGFFFCFLLFFFFLKKLPFLNLAGQEHGIIGKENFPRAICLELFSLLKEEQILFKMDLLK